MNKKHIATSATFVGTIIGAGFASGREISLYFGHTSFFSPVLASLFLGVLCYVFLELGRLTDGNIFSLFDKSKKIVALFLKLTALISLCAMVSGGGEILNSIFKCNIGYIITSLLILIVFCCGVEKIKLCNVIIVPLIVFVVIYLSIKNITLPVFEKFVALPSFTYATMNIISGGYFISTFSGKNTSKDNAIIATISTVFVGLILLLIFCSIQDKLDESMPLVSVANAYNVGYLANILMYLAIFTTAISSISIATANNKLKGVGVSIIALAVSFIPFAKIVNTTYPIIGIIGGGISIICVFIYIKILVKKPNRELLHC